MVPAREGRPVDEVYMKDKLLLGALSLRAFGPMSFEYLQLAWARRNPRAREQGLNRRSRGERYRSEGLSVCSVVTPVLSPRPVRPTRRKMMTRHGTAIALALVAPLALGAAGASSASASPLGTGAGKVPSAYESSKAVSLDGAGANSIDPFFATAFLRLPRRSPHSEHELLAGRQQRRRDRHPAGHRQLRRRRDPYVG